MLMIHHHKISTSSCFVPQRQAPNSKPVLNSWYQGRLLTSISRAHRYYVGQPSEVDKANSTAWLPLTQVAAVVAISIWLTSRAVKMITPDAADAQDTPALSEKQLPSDDETTPAYMTPAQRWAAKYLETSGGDAGKKIELEAEGFCQVLYCASSRQSAGMLGSVKMQGFLRAAVERYSATPGSMPLTGLLIAFPTCSVHFLEGDLSCICALLRSLSPENVAQHCLEDIRVVSYQNEETTDRLFQGWQVASTLEGSKHQLSRSVRSSLIKNGSVQILSPAGEKECAKTVEDLLLFVRLVAARLEPLQSQEECNSAVQDLSGLNSSLPSLQSIAQLTNTNICPSISDFLEANDMEFERYQLMSSRVNEESGLDTNEGRRLSYLYKEHAEHLASAASSDIQSPSEERPSNESPLSHFYPRTGRGQK
ncbi:hypothetical protein CEUSTIGMA_g328.t1 [Chlamydomonas eustigma]|uniref:BLUF domain-containing protein n=1 Tax=Chlamydomonas eustigma TaxID=1157962 RepID=A0A250WPX6_9CHLO|nr:hypothetical protein CEUSTIGMA_g328.t1 [Chlamydomonas eustigma]|eukprot:GAX72873.1 hypothetical protein CEUSTIGMA_g328.t1 [Chlamydomonas eustigma]